MIKFFKRLKTYLTNIKKIMFCQIIFDIIFLGVDIMNCKWFSVCPMKYFYENGKLDKKWIDSYCKGNWKSCERYQMEESGKYHPDNMLPDGRIDDSL